MAAGGAGAVSAPASARLRARFCARAARRQLACYRQTPYSVQRLIQKKAAALDGPPPFN